MIGKSDVFMKANRWESFLTSWKFFSLLVVLQFILMPVATKGFKFEAAGDIVFYTLQHAFIMDMYSYSFYFQVMMILALIAVVVWKGKFSRFFTAITGCFYLLYAVIQNMAVTAWFQHGNSERCNDWFRSISLAVGCMEGQQ